MRVRSYSTCLPCTRPGLQFQHHKKKKKRNIEAEQNQLGEHLCDDAGALSLSTDALPAVVPGPAGPDFPRSIQSLYKLLFSLQVLRATRLRIETPDYISSFQKSSLSCGHNSHWKGSWPVTWWTSMLSHFRSTFDQSELCSPRCPSSLPAQ